MSSLNVRRVRAEELFVTPEIKRSPWARAIYQGLTLMVTEDEMIPGHFGTFIGATSVRTYVHKDVDDPFIDPRYVQDLYHLHECRHLRTFGTNPKDSFMDWTRRMVRSETSASLTSEGDAYVMIDGLRERTFRHEIWIDRFLRDTRASGTTKQREELCKRIAKRRIKVLNSPLNDDYIEHQIHNYAYQNVQWCRLWADPVGYGPHAKVPAFRVVETHMARTDWMDRHQEWLEEVSAPDEKGRPTPFLNQAIAFEPIYHHTNLHFGNAVLMR